MKISVSIFFITGFIFLTAFLIGKFFFFNRNASLKQKSAYSIFLAVSLLLYIISVLFVSAAGLFFGAPYLAFYMVFALFPFVIGKIATYKKLEFYTNLQIAIVLMGCISSFLILVLN